MNESEDNIQFGISELFSAIFVVAIFIQLGVFFTSLPLEYFDIPGIFCWLFAFSGFLNLLSSVFGLGFSRRVVVGTFGPPLIFGIVSAGRWLIGAFEAPPNEFNIWIAIPITLFGCLCSHLLVNVLQRKTGRLANHVGRSLFRSK